VNNVKGKFNSAAEWLGSIINEYGVTNGIKDSIYLKPYNLLYWLKETNHKYVFPMISNPPTYGLNNSYGETNSDVSAFSSNSLLSAISDFVGKIPGAIRDIEEIINFTTNNGNKPAWQGTFVEKAKFYQYPQETEEYTISFPLINTTEKNAWKKNYKFFLLRFL
jgi:hypothetical protein